MFVPVSRRAFSLIELVIVVVIIGIIAAIAIPRMSRGATGASEGSLTANLAVLRNAIDLYQTEHGAFPTDHSTIKDQLTLYTNDAGGTSTTKTGTHIWGPYLRAVPKLPVGSNKGKEDFVAAQGGSVAGWVYTGNVNGGVISANLPVGEVDSRGTPYNSY